MAQIGLKKENIDAIKFAFDVYELTNDGKVDAFYTGDLFNTYKLNSNLKTIEGIGRIAEKGDKYLQKEELYHIYKAYKEYKEEDNFNNFMENLKPYDEEEHQNETKGKTNEVLKAIKVLIREIKRNKVDIPQNIKTHVTKMPIPPPSKIIPIKILRLEQTDGYI